MKNKFFQIKTGNSLLKDEKMKDAARAMIANFDHALSHPDETDLKQAEAFALRVAAMIDAV